MADVFISYKREDREHAERLAEALEHSGLEVWYDFELISGDRYRDVIRRVIDQCGAAVVIWSKRSVSSEFVLDEAGHAKARGKLCPVRIDDTDLPFGFGQTHTDDLTDWEGKPEHPGFRRLLKAISVKLGNPASASQDVPKVSTHHAKLEFDAFKFAQAHQTDAALLQFLRQFPDGSFATVVRDQLKDRAKLVSRFRRLPMALRIAIVAAPLGAGALAIHGISAWSVEQQLGALTGRVEEPLRDDKLAELVRKSLELVAKGECSENLMEAMLLNACRAQIEPMRTAVGALGKIVEVKSEGRHRSAASGGALRTRILVRFERGEQRWEVLGSNSGKLFTFFMPQ